MSDTNTKLEKMQESAQPYNLLYQWARNGSVSLKEFERLIREYTAYQKREFTRDAAD